MTQLTRAEADRINAERDCFASLEWFPGSDLAVFRLRYTEAHGVGARKYYTTREGDRWEFIFEDRTGF